MSDNLTRSDIKAGILGALKAAIAKSEGTIAEVAAREAAGAARLNKTGDGTQVPIEVAKNAQMGYGPKVAGTSSPKVPGPMGKDEDHPDDFDFGCPKCGGSFNHLGTLGNTDHFRCRNCGAQFSVPQDADEAIEKVTPPDVSEKVVHKLKDEYGHDKEGKAKAFATAWKIHNQKQAKKAEISAVDHANEKASPKAKLPGAPKKAANDEGSGGLKKACLHKASDACPHCGGTGKKTPTSARDIDDMSNENVAEGKRRTYNAGERHIHSAVSAFHGKSPWSAKYPEAGFVDGIAHMQTDTPAYEVPEEAIEHDSKSGKTFRLTPGSEEDEQDREEIPSSHPAAQYLAGLAAHGAKAASGAPVIGPTGPVQGRLPLGKAGDGLKKFDLRGTPGPKGTSLAMLRGYARGVGQGMHPETARSLASLRPGGMHPHTAEGLADVKTAHTAHQASLDQKTFNPMPGPHPSSLEAIRGRSRTAPVVKAEVREPSYENPEDEHNDEDLHAASEHMKRLRGHKFEPKKKPSRLESDIKMCKNCGKPYDEHKTPMEKAEYCGSMEKAAMGAGAPATPAAPKPPAAAKPATVAKPAKIGKGEMVKLPDGSGFATGTVGKKPAKKS